MMQISGGCRSSLSLSASLLPRPQHCPSRAFLPSPSSHLVLEEEGEALPSVTHCHSWQGASTLTALRGPASLFSLRAAQFLFSIEVKFTLHIISHFKVYNSVTFYAFTGWCNHHLSGLRYSTPLPISTPHSLQPLPQGSC